MNRRARDLIRSLKLQPHPEGGHFAEVFRSPKKVGAKQGMRPAITTIYFLLLHGERSHWHCVASDEVWHFIEGSALRLHHVKPDFSGYHVHHVGPLRGKFREPLAIIPAGDWQAAETTGAYTLVSCDVGPGFDFVDFVMLRDLAAKAAVLRKRAPRLAKLI